VRNLLVVIGIFAGTLLYLNSNQGDYSILPQASSTSVDREQFFEIADLYESRTTFAQMSEADAYTIVEVYADNCGRCKVLEASFPSLLRKRDDIVIKRVKTLSGSISFDTEVAANKSLSANPSRVKAVWHPVRNHDSCDWVSIEIFRINDDAFTLIDIFVLNKANDITVVFI
jgi:hypothetical protein